VGSREGRGPGEKKRTGERGKTERGRSRRWAAGGEREREREREREEREREGETEIEKEDDAPFSGSARGGKLSNREL